MDVTKLCYGCDVSRNTHKIGLRNQKSNHHVTFLDAKNYSEY